MLKVVCVNADNYQGRGAEYVNKLHDMVRRNLPNGFEGEFVCFTDSTMGLGIDIIARSLPETGLKGWWNKLALFKPGVFDKGDRVLYFDLDTLITGRLDELAAYDGPFAILDDFYRPGGFQSSVMAWDPAVMGFVWEQWEAAGRPTPAGGDQECIQAAQPPGMPLAEALQVTFPNLFVSYKVTGGQIPEKASVVVFHGNPRPHEILTGWVPEVWKIGGITRAELDAVCNTAHEKLWANVRANIKRDLPWLDYVDAHDGHVAIVGGGPSVVGCLDEIRWRQSLGQKVWALNGSARWLIGQGIMPDALVIADARPENIAFVLPLGRGRVEVLQSPPIEATYFDGTENVPKLGEGISPLREQVEPGPFLGRYLLASQCDPALFDTLPVGSVTLWHSNAPGVADILASEEQRPVHLVGGGSTVGLSAMAIAKVEGFRKIHLYGFDSSYAESGHHAYPQSLNDGEMVVDAHAGNRKFRCAPWMVQQAEEFVGLARWLAEEDCVVTVAGDGLLPTLAHDMARNPQLSAAQLRAHSVLSRLPSGPVLGAEIGVFAGGMSKALLEANEDLSLFLVDAWAGHGATYVGQSGDWHAGLSQATQDDYCKAAQRAAAPFGERATIIRDTSTHAARFVADGSLDFVFIDADHSYEGCSNDIKAWLPKLKAGGLLSGHDYANPGFPLFGVTRAVDEFVKSTGLALDLGPNFTWFVRLPQAAARAA